MLCPDGNSHEITQDDVMRTLILIHGEDVRTWPAKIPEVIKTTAETYLQKENRNGQS